MLQLRAEDLVMLNMQIRLGKKLDVASSTVGNVGELFKGFRKVLDIFLVCAF